jgi:hypothetical protein
VANAWSDIDCAEESKSQSESYDDDRGIMKASVVLRCAYSDRHLLVADVCGGRRSWPKGAAGAVPRALTAAIVPVETPSTTEPTANGQIAYEEALVTVNYTTEIKEIASESLEPTVEFLTLDHRNFAWGSGVGEALTEEEAPGRLVRGLNFVRTEYDKITLEPELLSLIGSVNSVAVTGSILALTFGIETLLFAPPTITYKIDSTNITKFEVVKKFTFNQHGWNSYYRGRTGNFQRIYRRGASSSYDNYPVDDLSPLL